MLLFARPATRGSKIFTEIFKDARNICNNMHILFCRSARMQVSVSFPSKYSKGEILSCRGIQKCSAMLAKFARHELIQTFIYSLHVSPDRVDKSVFRTTT